MKKIHKVSVGILVAIFVFSIIGLTIPSVALAATAPDLGDASSFAVLAGSGIVSTNPPQVIIGDAGSSPTASNGLTAVEVTGTNYTAAEAAVGAAKVDSAIAYTNISTQPQSGADIPSDLATQNLMPGVYHAASGTFEISGAGVLTLDGGGNPSAVFIFKTDTTLITGGASSVILTNGAQARNVFWAVGTSATLDNTTFVGTIMAEASITDTGNSNITGRLLADADNDGIGAVTLNNTDVTVLTSLTLDKIVINDDSGVSVPSDWILTATGTTTISGPGAVGSTDVVSGGGFLAGTYTLSESAGPAGYTASSWSCIKNGGAPVTGASITLVAGDVAVCTITNDDDAPIPLPAPTLTLVKVLVNDNGGTAVVNDFQAKIDGANVAWNTPITLTAGLHTASEIGLSGYSASVWGGACAGNGTITLALGDALACTITNNDIAPSGGGASYSPVVPPLIDVVKVPSPLALPAGPGSVNYTYTLTNIGTVPVTDITMAGDTCSPITLTSGDSNSDARLDLNETWIYNCSTTLSATHTNTVTATGWANGVSATDVASATVVVGESVVPPLIHITKVPNPLTLGAGGGMVTYTKKVTNPGTVPLSNVRVTDDKCSPISYISGDTNSDSRLDVNETWTYTCRVNLAQTTTNTAIATGTANGLTATDFAIATVIVAASAITYTVPTLPNTGAFPMESILFWLVAIVGISVVIIYAIRKKQTR